MTFLGLVGRGDDLIDQLGREHPGEHTDGDEIGQAGGGRWCELSSAWHGTDVPPETLT